MTLLLLHPLLPPSTHRKTEKEKQFAEVRGWEGAKSYDGEKAWSSINHSILSATKTYDKV
jgi:hypothetical protein